MFEPPRLWALLRPEWSHMEMEPSGMIYTASLHLQLNRNYSVSTSGAEHVCIHFLKNSWLLQYHRGWSPTLQLKMVWQVLSGHLAEAGEVSSVQLEGRSCLPVPGCLLSHVLTSTAGMSGCLDIHGRGGVMP